MAKRKKDGVQPFEEILDEGEGEVEDEITDEEMEELMANKESAKAKARRAKEDEVEDNDEVEEEEDDDDEVTDDASDEDEDEDDDDDDEDEDDEWAQFAPFIVHEEQDWDLDSILKEAEPGETVILYHLETNHWFKLEPIKVGEAASK